MLKMGLIFVELFECPAFFMAACKPHQLKVFTTFRSGQCSAPARFLHHHRSLARHAVRNKNRGLQQRRLHHVWIHNVHPGGPRRYNNLTPQFAFWHKNCVLAAQDLWIRVWSTKKRKRTRRFTRTLVPSSPYSRAWSSFFWCPAASACASRKEVCTFLVTNTK